MKILISTLFLSLLFISISGQQVVSSTGANATGGGGNMSYTIGQVVYPTNTGSNGSVAHGNRLSFSPQDQDKISFVKPAFSFEKFSGLTFRLSEPYFSGTNQEFTIALEIENSSDDELTGLTFRVKLFDKNGKVLSESINNCGPLTFVPASGKTIPTGYKGVYEKFCYKDKGFANSFEKIEIELTEIKTAPKGLYDKPEFDTEFISFENFEGLEFRISKPYQYLDDLSGNSYFAIALEFRNKTNKPLEFLNFIQKVYDDQGLLVDREVQNHNQMYEPRKISDQIFPAGYSGINMKFYINDLDFAKVYQKLEYQLISVDY